MLWKSLVLAITCLCFIPQVYVTMYLNDCQRTAFYEGIGLNTKEFDMHVIIEVNEYIHIAALEKYIYFCCRCTLSMTSEISTILRIYVLRTF